jgi:hypothetical protein
MCRSPLFLVALTLGCAQVESPTPSDAALLWVPDSAPDAAPSLPDAAASDCPAAADCAGRACGPDEVCGASCGACPEQHQCTPDGVCLCAPDCADRACGEDGCGGTCGQCEAGTFCADGACRTPPPGCPDTAQCGGRACGPDPECGVPCGRCADGEACRDGDCACLPQCGDRVCGDDGCGGRCGGCALGAICEDGRCVDPPPACPDTAECGALRCGNDPICGVSCGVCAANEACDQGRCVCVPDCQGRSCGADACGGQCGECEAGEACADGRCRCVPACDGSQCGSNGCGGQCGDCPGDLACVQGLCTCPGEVCGAGCCDEGEECRDGECCARRWRTPLEGAHFDHAMADAAGRVFVAGGDGRVPQVRSLDACTGEADAARLLEAMPTVAGAAARGITSVAGGDIIVGGTVGGTAEAPGDAFFARLDAATLAPQWQIPLVGGGHASAWDVATDAQGDLWLSGTVVDAETGSSWWMVVGDDTGRACGFQARPSPAEGRGLWVSQGRVYAAGSAGGQLTVLAFDESCAYQAPPCVCPVAQTYTASEPGAAVFEARGVVAHGDHVYAAGFSLTGARSIGHVLAFDRATGALQEHLRWQPGVLLDGLLGMDLAPDGSLVVAGGHSFDGIRWDGARAIVLRLGTPDLRVLAEWDLGPGVAGDVTVDPHGGLVIPVVHDAARTEVIRCPFEGPCP